MKTNLQKLTSNHLNLRFPFIANEAIACDPKGLYDKFFTAPSED